MSTQKLEKKTTFAPGANDIPIPKLNKDQVQALKSTLGNYTHLSPHYAFSSASLPDSPSTIVNWNKKYDELAIIDVPSIFYGSSLKKGTVNLKYYLTGTLIGQLQDEKQNGELIQVGPVGSNKSGSVAGVVLYNEGLIVLTGSWDLTSTDGAYGPAKLQCYQTSIAGTAPGESPQWVFFGNGTNDGDPDDFDSIKGEYTDGALPTGKHFFSSSWSMAFFWHKLYSNSYDDGAC